MPLPLLLVALTLAAQDKPQTVPLTLVAGGMGRHLGTPAALDVPLSTKRPAGLNKLPAGVTGPLFGTLKLGGSRFLLLLGTVAKNRKLFVDSNGDGDLTNDPPAVWNAKSATGDASGYAQVRLGFKGRRVACNVLFVQTGPKGLEAITDYGYAGKVTLGKHDVPFYLVDGGRGFADGKPAGAKLGLDRKGNGVISGPAEEYVGEAPFTVDGTSLVLRAVDLAEGTASFVPSERVAEIPLPRELAANQPSPTFATTSTDGRPVNFPADFSSRVVLIYAWASWSKPSLDWLPRVSRAYDSFKNLGFSVLGLSLNRAGETEAVKQANAQMPWTTGFDGKSWQGDAVRALSLNTLPFVLLVDGKTGKILATMDDMVGNKFDTVIRAAVVAHS